MILCDYCDKPALNLVSSGSAASRRFSCQGHQHDARHKRIVELPRTRRPESTFEQLEGVLREQRKAERASKP